MNNAKRYLLKAGGLLVLLLICWPGRNPVAKQHPFPFRSLDRAYKLPLSLPDSLVKPLRSLQDAQLQKELEKLILKDKRLTTLSQSKRLGIGLVDMSDPAHVKFAQINGQQMMYAASLPKIAVLLAAMDALENEELEDTPELRQDMRLMIAKSNNSATTRVIDRLGFEKIATVLQDQQYCLYDECFGGGLWVGKRYAATGARKGDPMKNLSHAASATQVCRFYYLLANGRLINRQRSEEMLTIMADPELHHKFVNTLDQVAPRATVYRKSGSWKQYHSDSALVWGPVWRRYILVALADDENGEKLMRNLMLQVDNLMKKRHDSQR